MWRAAVIIWAGLSVTANAQVIERFGPGSQERWRYIADGVMGGVSQGRAQITDDGLRLTGTVSTANNGGFIQVRHMLPEALPSDATSITLKVRGNGARYTVFLRTLDARRPWHNYKASFTAPQTWTTVSLPLSAFERSNRTLPATLDPARVTSIGLAGYGADYEADLTVSEVSAQ